MNGFDLRSLENLPAGGAAKKIRENVDPMFGLDVRGVQYTVSVRRVRTVEEFVKISVTAPSAEAAKAFALRKAEGLGDEAFEYLSHDIFYDATARPDEDQGVCE